ncbi:hypothetical protein FBU30_009725 [Linnemannia zychae]|nr:hypothetical protein FBU30_009725 [Linnemannia zychae]
MPPWSKTGGSEKPVKAKTSKPSKVSKPPPPEIVIIMPRRKKEFGMGTFGTEPMDAITSPPPVSDDPEPQPSTTIAPISFSLSKHRCEDDNKIQQEHFQHQQFTTSIPHSQTNDINANGDYTNSNYMQQVQTEQSSRKSQLPLSQSFGNRGDKNSVILNSNMNNGLLSPAFSTLSTPGSIGLTTPHPSNTSYFPTTQISDNTLLIADSIQAASITAVGDSQSKVDGGCSTLKHKANDNNAALPSDTPQSSAPPAFSDIRAAATSPITTTNPNASETNTKRFRQFRSDAPPAIITQVHNPPSTPNHQFNSIYQTPSTPRMHSAFSNLTHELSSSGFYPTPASSLATATTMVTPKSPGSMNEWRMMQMQLQHQDDLHFSLSLPSASTLSLKIPNKMTANSISSPIGLTSGSGTGSVSVSVSGTSSACSCCCCGVVPVLLESTNETFQKSSSTTHELTSVTSATKDANPQCGSSMVKATTNTHSRHYHGFLLNSNSSKNTLAVATALGNGVGHSTMIESSIYQHGDSNSSGYLYSHCNSSSSSTDCLSSHNCHSVYGEGYQPYSEHGTKLCLVGSTGTLAPEYTISSINSCAPEQGGIREVTTGHHHHHHCHHRYQQHHQLQFNNGHVYPPSSAGSEVPQDMLKNHPYLLRSAPVSAVSSIGNTKRQQQYHYKNCIRYNQRTLMDDILSPSLVGGENFHSPSGMENEVTESDTLENGRSSSPSSGSFKNLSSKLAANTIRKLSLSQKSLFNSSKEDLLTNPSTCQYCQENISREDLNDLLNIESSRAASYCCCTNQQSARGFSDDSCYSRGGNASTTFGNKGLKVSNKLILRGPNIAGNRTGRSRSRKGYNKTLYGLHGMEYNFSSQLVREEFAQYNYERQIEDFQRAARVFKEQKALTAAAATASIAAETRAAIAEAAQAAVAGSPKNKEYRSWMGETATPTPSSISLMIDPIQETEDVNERNKAAARHSIHSDDSNFKSRKKPASSTRSGLLRSLSRSQRRVGSNIASLTGPKSSQRSYITDTKITCHGSRRSSIHTEKSDVSYLELSHVGIDLSMDLKPSELGLGSRHSNTLDIDARSLESPSKISDGLQAINCEEQAPIDVRTETILETRMDTRVGYEDTSLHEAMHSSPHSLHSNDPIIKLQKDTSNSKRRPSGIIQETRGDNIKALTAGDMSKENSYARTGRSVHSFCSVDSVSQRISARHHQHSRFTNLSNVASLHSQPQALHSTCETTDGGATCNCAAVISGSCMGKGLGGGSGASVYQSATGNILENSPIQVVRATVGTVDDPSLPCFTFRMWTLSTLFVVMGAAIAEYNFFRSNSAYFSIYFVQLASYFCGKAMARWLPTRVFEFTIPGLYWIMNWRRQNTNGNNTSMDRVEVDDLFINSNNSALSSGWRLGFNTIGGPIRGTDIYDFRRNSQRSQKQYSWRFTLNPGKFNMKEHMLIGIAAAAGCTPAYATNVLAIQDLVFALPLGTMTGIGLVISSQLIGFSMAWLMFDYVIKPSVMIWPATLVNVSLYNTLHEHKVLTRWFTRMQLFCNVLRKLGSGYMGLGIGCISLDWSIISGVGPLFTPWWAQCNFFVGLIIMLWIITPIVYFSDYWSAMSYPIVSSNLFDNSSQFYDVSRIVNKDLSFNITMYENYSPIVMTPYFAITYGTSFMAVIATFVHVSLYYGSDIWLIAKTRFTQRISRTQSIPFTLSFKSLFGKKSQYEPEQASLESRTSRNISVTNSRHIYVGLDGLSPSLEHRNSESLSFRHDRFDGGAGIGFSSEDQTRFSQPSYYHSLSQNLQDNQHQETLFPPGPLQPSEKYHSNHQDNHNSEDRDQIPTEMFGTEDIHTALMRAYPQIPGWWFGLMFTICFTVAVFVCITTEIQLPVYALILALILAAVFAIPMAIIQALSSSQVGLNVLSEVVCGYLLPGNQLGNSVFKCYSYMALYQCLNMTQSFKLGHYMKVPPLGGHSGT